MIETHGVVVTFYNFVQVAVNSRYALFKMLDNIPSENKYVNKLLIFIKK